MSGGFLKRVSSISGVPSGHYMLVVLLLLSRWLDGASLFAAINAPHYVISDPRMTSRAGNVLASDGRHGLPKNSATDDFSRYQRAVREMTFAMVSEQDSGVTQQRWARMSG